VSTTTKGQKLLDLDIERTWMTATPSLISFGAIDSIGKHAGRNKGSYDQANNDTGEYISEIA
jgi:hypothetical protein